MGQKPKWKSYNYKTQEDLNSYFSGVVIEMASEYIRCSASLMREMKIKNHDKVSLKTH